MKEGFLETPRLLFRAHGAEDEADFISMQMDPEVRRYVGGRPWPREEAIRRFREHYLGEPSETYGLWATVLKAEGRYIGHCGLRRDTPKSAHLAYYLARPYWGQGLATEASRAFLQLAFDRLFLERVEADVTKGHAASENLLLKLGFGLVSEYEIPGRIIRNYGISSPL